uniref:SCP2 domain-containing protein n=1 Tax=Chlamydomonas leiostraca TaxID=1034604 RepID=A0A7S0WZF5_9CHLO|mmetsp:Transcript_37471/g.94572  ORF Transcript_37471/g.94572 Transcript_37471/m.94572 type:complete len:128 (+) Transcript_37471:71-454(+)|eukprot:CAMPEP_0202866946 /NCGR_PEP_ID=MMETSP1391-20130828/8444_1 /ASSEMBLY_ACC=CAM_ASM_000867 /TAXON_ID=1034604 /ORGANISM="Chlamydomonas leiostraca, Strain SAG 11-49" /LENGTH=127 /DNA_ID=CAMNT_0049546937 /DNA_START=77 /DNA_END=460 /DNA_ORIENTATION=-
MERVATAGAGAKASTALMEQLGQSLKSEGATLAKRVKGLVVFKIDDEEWALDLRPDSEAVGTLAKGPPSDKPDITLTMTDAVFAQLVAGKLNPQNAFMMRKLKIAGSMALAMKLQPILDAAAPKSKL